MRRRAVMICIKVAPGAPAYPGIRARRPVAALTRQAPPPVRAGQGAKLDGTQEMTGFRRSVSGRRGSTRLIPVLLMLAGLAGAAPAGQPLGLGTMAPGTISHSTGLAIAGVMIEQGGPEIRVLPQSGERVLLDLLAVGELDFAVANALETWRAVAEDAERRAGSAELAVAAVLYPLRVGLFVRADGDIAGLGDLAGRRVTTGFASSPAIGRMLDAVLASAGLDRGDIVPVPVSDLIAGADRFADGRVDAFFFALGAAKLAEVSATVPLRLLSLPDAPGAEARARAVAPVVYFDDVAPRPALAGVDTPAVALSFDNLLVTRADAPAHAVEAVLRVLRREREALVARVPAFAGMAPGALGERRSDLPRHPVTRRMSPAQ